MDIGSLPTQEWPQRVPLKVIGRLGELQAEMIVATFLDHLGPQEPEEGSSATNCKGAFISYTFWVTLPEAGVEPPLRAALAKLPGYIMQL